MAHFAELDENNVVLRVLVVPNEEENRGQEYLAEDLGMGGRWEKTSYNTKFGIYYDPETNIPTENQSKAFRKNYACPGYIFDETRNAFILPKPEEFPSWIINENTGDWEPPIPRPQDDRLWDWNEENQEWIDLGPITDPPDDIIGELLPPVDE